MEYLERAQSRENMQTPHRKILGCAPSSCCEATVITTALFFDKGNVNIWLYTQLGLDMFEMSCNLIEFWFVFMFIFT